MVADASDTVGATPTPTEQEPVLAAAATKAGGGEGVQYKETSSSSVSSSSQSSSDSDSGDSDSEDSECSYSSADEDERAEKKSSKEKASKDESEAKETDVDSQEQAKSKSKPKKKRASKDSDEKKKKKKARKARPEKPKFFRADEVWDKKTNSFKLKKTRVRKDKDEYGQYIFHVRRCFDTRGELERIRVDIKSQTLKKLLQIVMDSTQYDDAFSEDQPELNPDELFRYIEDIRQLREKIVARSETSDDEDIKKRARVQAAQLACLLEYLDKDYERVKVRQKALIEAGDITFDLIWTLFRPESLAYMQTYNTPEEPRAIRVTNSFRSTSMLKGTTYIVEGECFNYDGKSFGHSTCTAIIDHFEGTRRINSLPCYPFKYHMEREQTEELLIQRGKKFANLVGSNYKSHAGLGYMKRDKQVLKVHVNSRVMIDPVVFRRSEPNYPCPSVRPYDLERRMMENAALDTDADEPENPEDRDIQQYDLEARKQKRSRAGLKLVVDNKDNPHLLEIPKDSATGEPERNAELEALIADGAAVKGDITEEELLIASPVVLGFAFTQKLWLEFTVSGLRDIEWNDDAFRNLVLPEQHKSLIKALVQSHASITPGRDTIDDVVKGKGKGLVAVLHGSPGVGKTLTAEGIADLLRRPLYYLSAGELGTSARDLEVELTKVLDVAQTWGAVLLLDEAEVFLEARTSQDIHRNALVSIFLRVLEYFCGILFLTTNRVTTFDAAFQSRIHFALRYQELDFQARRSIFKMFIERVASFDQPNVPRTAVAVSDDELDRLARRSNVNGRQIKNAVRSAQALAQAEDAPMGMKHIMRVLDASESFEQDLKGGSGYADAMRSYM